MSALALARAMLDQLDPVAVAELERTLSRALADERAQRAAASGAAAARAVGAAGLPEPARRVSRGPGSRAAYTREHVVAAVRRCAQARGRRPTWTTFDSWALVERARIRRRDGAAAVPRVPSWSVFVRLWPREHYAGALRAAAITDEEVRRWRHALLGVQISSSRTAAEALAEVSDEQLRGMGLPDEALGLLRAGGPTELAVPEVSFVAVAIGGSLHWLAGCDADPAAAPDGPVVFSREAMTARRRQLGVTDRELRGATGLGTPAWTRIVRGFAQPTLGTLSTIAEVLGVRCEELCVRQPPQACTRPSIIA